MIERLFRPANDSGARGAAPPPSRHAGTRTPRRPLPDPIQRLVFAALARERARAGDGPCRPSLQRLAGITGAHPAAVTRALDALEASGHIRRLHPCPGETRYLIHAHVGTGGHAR